MQIDSMNTMRRWRERLPLLCPALAGFCALAFAACTGGDEVGADDTGLDPVPSVASGRRWLAPPEEALLPDPGFPARRRQAAYQRFEEEIRSRFEHASTTMILEGVVVDVEAVAFKTGNDDAPWVIGTRQRIKTSRSWKAESPVEIDVLSFGGQLSPFRLSGPPYSGETVSTEIYLEVGNRVVLALTEAPLFPGDEPRLRINGGRYGALFPKLSGKAPVELQASISRLITELNSVYSAH